MLILGIESSCDDTAAAVVRDGSLILSSVVSSQDTIHGKYGGIVPELASRTHIESVIPVVDEALRRAGTSIDGIDAIAVTQGPGLVGSILIGLTFAKAVSFARNIPFTGVNHIEAHPYAVFLSGGEGPHEAPEPPFVALVASGGHTTLMLFEDYIGYRVLGQTLDDAAGEAFDKAAKLLGLGYPGGAVIDRLAREGDPGKVRFTRPYISKDSLDFSFSGLKTAVMNHVRASAGPLSEAAVKDLAASFQEAVVDVLVAKAALALEASGVNSLVVAGGVACNTRLRARLKEASLQKGFRLFSAPPHLCSDNGAVIAALGHRQLKKGETGSLDMNAKPTWEGF